MIIGTPVGKIKVSVIRNTEYPGFKVSLVGAVNEETLAAVEYCKSKNIVQAVIYNSLDNIDTPSDIIEFNSAIHSSVAEPSISTDECIELLEDLICKETDKRNINALKKAIQLANDFKGERE